MAHEVSAIEITNLIYGEAISERRHVRVATTGPGNLNTSFAAGQIIDNVTLILNDRILIKDQIDGIENGFYYITASTPLRTVDMEVGTHSGTTCTMIEEGTINANTRWMCTHQPGADITGVDPLSYRSIIGGGRQEDIRRIVDTATTTALALTPSIASATYNANGGLPAVGEFTGTLSLTNSMTVDGITYTSANNGTRILLKNENTQINRITTVADVGGSLNNKYFLVHSSTINYYVWYNVNGTGIDPAPGGTGVMVAISTGASASTVRNDTETAMTATISDLFIERTTVPTNGLNIYANGPVTNPSDGSAPTGFTFSVIAVGNGSANGIYIIIINGTAFTLKRAPDFNIGSLVPNGAIIVVNYGTTNHDTVWQLSGAPTPVIIGTLSGTVLTFIKTSNMITSFPSNLIIGEGAAPSIAYSSAQNVIVGNSAAAALTVGRQNTIIGDSAGIALTSGGQNTSLGYQSLLITTTGTGNVAVGNGTFSALTTGSNNVAAGLNAGGGLVSGTGNIAIGISTTLGATITNAITIGNLASATNTSAISIGDASAASGTSGIAIGNSADVGEGGSVDGAIAIGNLARVAANVTGGGIAIGLSAYASGAQSIAIGRSSTAGINTGLAICRDSVASGSRSIAIGWANASNALAAATDSIALGTNAQVTAGTDSIVIGRGNTTAGAQSIVLGSGLTGAASTFTVGGSGITWWQVGAVATITQLTSNTTAVTINGYEGIITMFGNVTAGTSAEFTVNNNVIVTTSLILMTLRTNRNILVTHHTFATGSFIIRVANFDSVNTTPIIHFVVFN